MDLSPSYFNLLSLPPLFPLPISLFLLHAPLLSLPFMLSLPCRSKPTSRCQCYECRFVSAGKGDSSNRICSVHAGLFIVVSICMHTPQMYSSEINWNHSLVDLLSWLMVPMMTVVLYLVYRNCIWRWRGQDGTL